MTNQAGAEDLAKSGGDSSRSIAMAIIIAVTVISLTFILACAATIIILIYNVPL